MRAFYATKVSEHLSETPEGYLLALGCPIARDGTMMYTRAELGLPGNGGDKVLVLRRHEEVFAPATLASFEGKPVVSPHPPQFVSPENWAGYAKGHIQHVRKGERFPDGTTPLVADLVITDATLISQVKAGLRELSAGYDCEYREVVNEHDPLIELEQTNIRGNHCAVIPRGRAGPNFRILDEHPEAAKEGVSVEIKAFKEALVDFKEVVSFLGFRSPGAGTTDVDPGAVERNIEKNAEALERARMRNRDDMPEVLKEKAEEKEETKSKDAMEGNKGEGGSKEMKKEEAGAEKPKESKDASARDAVTDRMLDCLDRISRRMDAMEEKEKEKEKKVEETEESQDSELIPVETLPAKAIPENPIPGAEKHVDAVRDALLAIKPMIAAAVQNKWPGARDAAAAWNNGWRGVRGTDGAYGAMTGVKKPDAVVAAESGSMRATQDSGADSEDYALQMRQFHRQNVSAVQIEKKERVM